MLVVVWVQAKILPFVCEHVTGTVWGSNIRPRDAPVVASVDVSARIIDIDNLGLTPDEQGIKEGVT
jgi:hypothetical protein